MKKKLTGASDYYNPFMIKIVPIRFNVVTRPPVNLELPLNSTFNNELPDLKNKKSAFGTLRN
jgi:hypothetical protein